jgi:hypothetical protein
MSSILDGLFADCRANIIDFVRNAVVGDKNVQNFQEKCSNAWMNVTKSGEGTSYLYKLSVRVEEFLDYETLRRFFIREVYVKDTGFQCLYESQNDVIDGTHPHQFLAQMTQQKYTRCCIFYKRIDEYSGETHIVIDVGKISDLFFTDDDYHLSWKMLSDVRDAVGETKRSHVLNSNDLLKKLSSTSVMSAMCIRCNKAIL